MCRVSGASVFHNLRRPLLQTDFSTPFGGIELQHTVIRMLVLRDSPFLKLDASAKSGHTFLRRILKGGCKESVRGNAGREENGGKNRDRDGGSCGQASRHVDGKYQKNAVRLSKNELSLHDILTHSLPTGGQLYFYILSVAYCALTFTLHISIL